jgi:hypothetical protein
MRRLEAGSTTRQALRRSPATVVALLALFAALGGTVYAAGRLDGRAIRVGSVPGNRLKPRSVSADRLRPAVLRNLEAKLAGPVTGSRVDERSLGQVPSADYADAAGVAQSAVDAQTALTAVNAADAATVNGHSAGCMAGTVPFAGACWQTAASEAPATAPVAASSCAARGGVLPEALQLAAFAQQPDLQLDPGGEWSGDIPVVSGPNVYGVVTVDPTGIVDFDTAVNPHHYRCVFPVLS